MEKDEIIQLLKSKDIEDRKLGVILLSKICKNRQEFMRIIGNVESGERYEEAIIFHTPDWRIRVYIGIEDVWLGNKDEYTLEDSLDEFGSDIERYELDI